MNVIYLSWSVILHHGSGITCVVERALRDPQQVRGEMQTLNTLSHTLLYVILWSHCFYIFIHFLFYTFTFRTFYLLLTLYFYCSLFDLWCNFACISLLVWQFCFAIYVSGPQSSECISHPLHANIPCWRPFLHSNTHLDRIENTQWHVKLFVPSQFLIFCIFVT